MKWLGIALSIALLLVAAPALAERPTVGEIGFSGGISPGELTATPEMWFYEQYLHQYQDPKRAVRQKAEFRAAQRQSRLASLRWFGLSNARPTAGSDPFHSTYSPSWASSRYRWGGFSPGIVVVRTERARSTY